MKKYIIKRLLQLIPMLLGITFLSYLLMYLAGGDAFTYMYENAGAAVSQEIIDAKKAEFGLDRPMLLQYADWLIGFLKGDMGISYISRQPVIGIIISKLPNTLLLTASSVLLTIAVSVPLGIISAVKRNKAADYIIRLCSFMGNSMPNFFAAVVLIALFSVKLHLLPAVTGNSLAIGLILPTLTLTISMAAKYTRQIRAAVLEEMQKDYVMGARARGVRERVIVVKSVLRTAMLTIITLIGMSVGSLLGGTAIVETIFMWDGLGKLAVDSITMRDYPVVQAFVVWMAIIYMLINLAADIIYHVLDPRVRLGGDEA